MPSGFAIYCNLEAFLLDPICRAKNSLERVLTINVANDMDAQLVVAPHSLQIGLDVLIIGSDLERLFEDLDGVLDMIGPL